jgi:hypothetical protein
MDVLTVPSDENDCVTEPWGQPFPDEDTSTMVISSGGSEVADWRGGERTYGVGNYCQDRKESCS